MAIDEDDGGKSLPRRTGGGDLLLSGCRRECFNSDDEEDEDLKNCVATINVIEVPERT